MKMMKRFTGFTILMPLLLIMCNLNSVAQTDTVNFKNNKLRTSQLKTGLKQYLVYLQQPNQKKKLNLSLWTREVRSAIQNGESRFIIIQKWFSTDTANYRSIYSVNRADDFAPIYHSETVGNQVKAFNWYADHINGADTVLDNKQKTFALQLQQPCFNWNLDIETLEMLPLSSGKKFILRLYDAGSGAPADIQYSVSGEEVLTTLDNRKVDCWKLLLEGDHGQLHYTQTFWISKKEHEFLMEVDAVNGMYRYKVKMPGFSPDIIQKFK